MDGTTALTMAQDLGTLGVDVTLHSFAGSWTVIAFKPGGVTAAKVASYANSYSVTAVTEHVRFT